MTDRKLVIELELVGGHLAYNMRPDLESKYDWVKPRELAREWVGQYLDGGGEQEWFHSFEVCEVPIPDGAGTQNLRLIEVRADESRRVVWDWKAKPQSRPETWTDADWTLARALVVAEHEWENCTPADARSVFLVLQSMKMPRAAEQFAVCADRALASAIAEARRGGPPGVGTVDGTNMRWLFQKLLSAHGDDEARLEHYHTWWEHRHGELP